MQLEKWLSLEGKEQDEHRDGQDTPQIEGRPWLARGHYNELFIP